jgi:hypothetical protein
MALSGHLRETPARPLLTQSGHPPPALSSISKRHISSRTTSMGVDQAASSPSAPSVDEPENDQKHDCADRGGDNGGDDTGAKADTQLRHQPSPD